MSSTTPLKDFIESTIASARDRRADTDRIHGKTFAALFIEDATRVLKKYGDSEEIVEATRIRDSQLGEATGLERAGGQLLASAAEHFVRGDDEKAKHLRGHAQTLVEKAKTLRSAHEGVEKK